MINNLENILIDQRELFESKRNWILRDIDFEKYIKTSHITVISEIRRSGKSTLLRQFTEKYEDYYYINFDDERLVNFTVQDFADMMLLFQNSLLQKRFLLMKYKTLKVGKDLFVEFTMKSTRFL